MKSANGIGTAQALPEQGPDLEGNAPSDWSRDGRFIITLGIGQTTRRDIWVLPQVGDRTPFVFLQTPAHELQPTLSPDARWVAYASDESGRPEVYVQPFPVGGAKWQVSTAGGMQPRWRRDGRELFYVGLDRTLTAVEVNGAGEGFRVGRARPLFDARVVLFGTATDYDAAADGQRFVVNAMQGELTSVPVTVALRWTAELKR